MGETTNYICLGKKHTTSHHFHSRAHEPSCPECGGKYGDAVFAFVGEVKTGGYLEPIRVV